MVGNDEAPESVAVGCILAAIALPLGIVTKAFALAKMWAWFIVPLGAPSLGAVHAYGLVLTVMMFTMGIARNKIEAKTTLTLSLGMLWSSCVPLVVLGLGWLVKLFM